MKKYRQGDLIIKEVESIPKGLEVKDDLVLIKGSSTGNNHVLENGKIYPKEDEMLQGYFILDKDTKLIHQTKDGKKGEHKTITLPKGKYAYYRQREYLPNSYTLVED